MQSLDLIKKRIKSIQATRKITNAMKLVATTKIKTQRKRFEAVSVFCHDYYRLFKQLILEAKSLDFLRDKPCNTKSSLYIVVTSDLGLCGSYNTNICKKLISDLKPDDKIIVYGQKGFNYLKQRHLDKQVVKQLSWNLERKNSYYALLPISYELMTAWVNGKYDQIKVVYTRFISSVKYETCIWNILPIWPDMFKDSASEDPINKTIYEPNSKEIIKSILPVYISNLIYGALVEGNLCESSSRRFAMEGATKNADELTEQLRVQYNQARQESITQEINEIVAGAARNKRS